MKDIIRKFIAFTSLFLALLIILSGGLGYLLISHEPQTAPLIFESQKKFSENKEKRDEIIENAEYGGEVTHIEGAPLIEARMNYRSTVEEYGIGSVYIPAGNISIPLLAGTSEWNLLNGVATSSPDQTLGEGLFVGTSHNLVNQRLLQNIDQVQQNDFVYLTDFSDVYIYKVSEQKVVHETESSYLEEPNEGEVPKLLLYRCEGKYNTDWRRIVYGDYITKEQMEEVDEEILTGLMIDVEVGNEENLEGNLESDSSKIYEESRIKENLIEKEKESKSTTQRMVSKIIDKVNQSDALTNFFLKVYGLADSYTVPFFLFVLLLFVIFYLV